MGGDRRRRRLLSREIQPGRGGLAQLLGSEPAVAAHEVQNLVPAHHHRGRIGAGVETFGSADLAGQGGGLRW